MCLTSQLSDRGQCVSFNSLSTHGHPGPRGLRAVRPQPAGIGIGVEGGQLLPLVIWSVAWGHVGAQEQQKPPENSPGHSSEVRVFPPRQKLNSVEKLLPLYEDDCLNSERQGTRRP